MDNKIYTRKEVLNEGINAKGKSKVFTLFFQINHLKFGVQYHPRYFGSMDIAHLSFYALSLGFEKYTDSGYRSCFVQNVKKVASYEEVKAYFVEAFEGIVDLGDSEEPIQLSLF